MRLLFQRAHQYALLMRFHKPIGIFLLLWPTLWALWIAGAGHPDPRVLMIFVMGVVVMRSAGCVMNDFADRKMDGHVARTKDRPLAAGRVSSKEALCLFVGLCAVALVLLLQLNRLTQMLALVGLVLTIIYPFMKRIIHCPQVVLGLAFAWSVPMAFAALTGHVPPLAWFLFLIAALWPITYDTLYAMADREDDLKIGIKSTAILFGRADKCIIAIIQGVILLLFTALGFHLSLGFFYYVGLLIATGLVIIQHYKIRHRDPQACFNAFLNNHWVGCAIFLGLLFK